LDFTTAFHAPFHPLARRMFKKLKASIRHNMPTQENTGPWAISLQKTPTLPTLGIEEHSLLYPVLLKIPTMSTLARLRESSGSE
jgi:hypothetical protein